MDQSINKVFQDTCGNPISISVMHKLLSFKFYKFLVNSIAML